MAVDKRLGELLDLVVKEGGSDLHIFAGGPPMLRISGALVPVAKYQALTNEETEAMLKSIVLVDRWDSFLEKQSIDLSYAHKENVRFRINGYRVQGTTALALRLIPRDIHTFTELNLPSILEVFTQREVHIDTPDFHTALQSAFREDVDVIMVGEMRDYETISSAVTAAETGHLVFSTLHTNNAAQTIDRIIDMFPAEQQSQVRVQLAGSLAGI